jgi:lipoyl(octanoyl) transferase
MGVAWYAMQGIEVVDTDRGGRVTYHGPGQLVGYPVMSLRPYRDDVHEYLRRMERAIVAALGAHGIEAGCIEGLTGVWTPARRKIASIGVHVSRGVTTHGFAVNVSNDLQPFEWIVACGIEHCLVTSLTREKGEREDLDRFAQTVRRELGRAYGREPVEVAIEALERRIDARPLAGTAA